MYQPHVPEHDLNSDSFIGSAPCPDLEQIQYLLDKDKEKEHYLLLDQLWLLSSEGSSKQRRHAGEINLPETVASLIHIPVRAR